MRHYQLLRGLQDRNRSLRKTSVNPFLLMPQIPLVGQVCWSDAYGALLCAEVLKFSVGSAHPYSLVRLVAPLMAVTRG
jgi:hypothetical protein